MVKKAAQAIPNQLLSQTRLERGWTQKDVADNGTRQMKWKNIPELSRSYHIDYLLSGERDSSLALRMTHERVLLAQNDTRKSAARSESL